MSYKQVRKDFEALERIAELSDQVELDAEREQLMQNPTKAKAAEMYHAAIELWFREHGYKHHEAAAIAKRYNIKP